MGGAVFLGAVHTIDITSKHSERVKFNSVMNATFPLGYPWGQFNQFPLN